MGSGVPEWKSSCRNLACWKHGGNGAIHAFGVTLSHSLLIFYPRLPSSLNSEGELQLVLVPLLKGELPSPKCSYGTSSRGLDKDSLLQTAAPIPKANPFPPVAVPIGTRHPVLKSPTVGNEETYLYSDPRAFRQEDSSERGDHKGALSREMEPAVQKASHCLDLKCCFVTDGKATVAGLALVASISRGYPLIRNKPCWFWLRKGHSV